MSLETFLHINVYLINELNKSMGKKYESTDQNIITIFKGYNHYKTKNDFYYLINTLIPRFISKVF